MKIYLSLLIFVAILIFELFAASFSLRAFGQHSNLAFFAGLYRGDNGTIIAGAWPPDTAVPVGNSLLISAMLQQFIQSEHPLGMCPLCQTQTLPALTDAKTLLALREVDWQSRWLEQLTTMMEAETDNQQFLATYLFNYDCKQQLIAMYRK